MKTIRLTVDADTAVCAQLRVAEQGETCSIFQLGIDMRNDGTITTTVNSTKSSNIIEFISNVLNSNKEHRTQIINASRIDICSDIFDDNPDLEKPMIEVNPKVFEGLTYDKDSDQYVGTLIIL